MVEDVDTIGTLTDNVQQKDKDEEDKEDVDTEEASSLDQTTADRRKDVGGSAATAGQGFDPL